MTIRLSPARVVALLLTAAVVVSPLARPPGAAGVSRAEAGSAGVEDDLFPKAGNGGYRVQHYDLHLRYAPDVRRLRARAEIISRSRTALRSFHLDLYGLRVDAVTVDGEAAQWSRNGQELVVRPARRIGRRDTFVTRVSYHGRPKTFIDPDGAKDGWVYTDDGAVVANEPVGAMTVFPSNNHPSDKARFDVAITVPKGLTGVSNGVLRSRRTTDGWTTWRWHEPDQMATYLMTATIGRFRKITQRGPGGLPILSFVDRRQPGAAAMAEKVPAVLRQLIRWYGPYPFVSSGVIIDKADIGYALEVQTRPVFDSTPGIRLLVHELAHQWFGNAVSPRTWQHIWLNEGPATYSEWLWAGRGQPGAVENRFDNLYASPPGSDLWTPPPADPGDPANLFGRPVYDRGAMALHAIRKQVGRATFLRICRRWAEKYGGGSFRTVDFRRHAERISGQQLDQVFADWVWLDGKPAGY